MMSRKGFALADCLLAAALACLLLPALAGRFSDDLEAFAQLRSREEAVRLADSSLARAAALRESGLPPTFAERAEGSFGVYDIETTLIESAGRVMIRAEVRWDSPQGEKNFTLTRAF